MEANPITRLILIVEDDEPTARMLARMIEIATVHHVISARAGGAGLHLARSEPVDLILTDMQMPDFDGLVLYDRLQADPATRDIPVLFMSANRYLDSLRDRGLENRFIRKPFELDALLAHLDTAFATT